MRQERIDEDNDIQPSNSCSLKQTDSSLSTTTVINILISDYQVFTDEHSDLCLPEQVTQHNVDDQFVITQ